MIFVGVTNIKSRCACNDMEACAAGILIYLNKGEIRMVATWRSRPFDEAALSRSYIIVQVP